MMDSSVPMYHISLKSQVRQIGQHFTKHHNSNMLKPICIDTTEGTKPFSEYTAEASRSLCLTMTAVSIIKRHRVQPLSVTGNLLMKENINIR